MNTKHTPGPWLIGNNGKQGRKSETFSIWRTDPDQPQGDDFRNIGYARIAPHVFGEANARLIAAAPEMLEALKLVRDSGMRNAAWDAACAAIAKAEGCAA